LGTLSTSSTHTLKMPWSWSQIPPCRRPRGSSSTRVHVCDLTPCLAQVLPPSTWMPVQEHQYCSWGSTTQSHLVKGASSMLPLVPLKIPFFHCHSTPVHVALHLANMPLPYNMPPNLVLKSGSCLTGMNLPWRNQGEYPLDLSMWLRRQAQRPSNTQSLMRMS
jgi:hypothetical protein